MVVSEKGNLEVATWLVNHGAGVTAEALIPHPDVQIGERVLRSAMLCATNSGHVSLVSFLYAQGASYICTAEGRTETALHVAAGSEAGGIDECVRFILASGLAVDTTNSDGATALHIAATSGLLVSRHLLSCYLSTTRTWRPGVAAVSRRSHKQWGTAQRSSPCFSTKAPTSMTAGLREQAPLSATVPHSQL